MPPFNVSTARASTTNFSPSSQIKAPPKVANWDAQFNPVPNVPPGWAAATITDHPDGGILIRANGVATHDAFAGIFMLRGTKTRWRTLIDIPVFDGQSASGSGYNPCAYLAAYDSANNKAVCFGLAGDTAGVGYLTVINKQYGAWTSNQPYLQKASRTLAPVWLELFDDGVNLNFSYSTDRRSITPIQFTQARGTNLAAWDYVGIGVECGPALQAHAGEQHVALWCGSWEQLSS